jgi:hypothetical protein
MAAAISTSAPFTIPATALSITHCGDSTRDALHARGESFLHDVLRNQSFSKRSEELQCNRNPYK